MLTLFQQYPGLAKRLPHADLGIFPTPVRRMTNLGKALGAPMLYLKDDGASGDIYGGNKVRKLEFLLGDALAKGKKSVLTFGYAGSNHALATAIYANRLGIKPVSILLKQANARYVGRNLLMGHAHGARMHHFRSEASAILPVLLKMFSLLIRDGRMPAVIPPGGSSPLGVVGYVNAAFELKAQVENGMLPEPKRIFVALGTMGTAVGLLLGLRAAGLSSALVSVRVTDEKFANAKKFMGLFEKTNALLVDADPAFPRVEIAKEEIHIRDDFFGGRYARFTPEGMAAVDRLDTSEGVKLEGTYTGKTMAALIDALISGGEEDSAVLFWNTYNAVDFSDAIQQLDYRRLPRPFHRYFEAPCQPLDT